MYEDCNLDRRCPRCVWSIFFSRRRIRRNQRRREKTEETNKRRKDKDKGKEKEPQEKYLHSTSSYSLGARKGTWGSMVDGASRLPGARGGVRGEWRG